MTIRQKIHGTGIHMLCLCLSGLLSGCLDESYDCPEGFRLQIETLNPDHPFEEIIRTLTLYFYTEKGDKVHEMHFDEDEIPSLQGVIGVTCLIYGNYRVAAIANESDYFKTTGENQLEQLTTSLVREGETPLPHLHTGMESFSFTRQNEGTVVSTVTLIKHTKHINLEVRQEGVGETTPIYGYITGVNSSYHYATHSCPDNREVVYVPDSETTVPDHIRFRLTTLRLWKDAIIDLVVEKDRNNPEAGSVTFNLPETLGKVVDNQGNLLYDTDEKLEYYDEYDILIRIDETFAVIGLTINGWQVIHGETPVK